MGLITMLNHFRYLLNLIIVHVGATNFSREHNALQRHHVSFMVQEINHILDNVACYTKHCHSILYSFLLGQLWFLGWKDQMAARCTRSRFNGHLAQVANVAGAYPVPHPDIKPEHGQLEFNAGEGGTPSQQDNLLF